MIISAVSDTHGLLRPEVIQHLRGSDSILHAGDIGSQDILAKLRTIAPVHAVRGNIDIDPWARDLPSTLKLELNDITFLLIHNRAELKDSMLSAKIRVVIYGHSHQPRIEVENGVLFFNPGSAGPRRFKQPISIGRITIDNGRLSPEFIPLG